MIIFHGKLYFVTHQFYNQVDFVDLHRAPPPLAHTSITSDAHGIGAHVPWSINQSKLRNCYISWEVFKSGKERVFL